MILPNYIFSRLFLSLKNFFLHWYVGAFRRIGHRAVLTLEMLDRTIAFRANAKNLFSPLFQDRSFVGYLLGFGARIIRIISGGILYSVISLAFTVVYVFWAALPIYLLYKTFSG